MFFFVRFTKGKNFCDFLSFFSPKMAPVSSDRYSGMDNRGRSQRDRVTSFSGIDSYKDFLLLIIHLNKNTLSIEKK